MEKTFEVLKEQRDYIEELDNIIRFQDRIDNRINKEFEIFMATVEEFRAEALKKLQKNSVN